MRKIGYIMKDGFDRKTTFQGLRTIERPGSIPNLVETVDIFFEPKKVSFVDEDIDMSPVVESRWIVRSHLEMDESGEIFSTLPVEGKVEEESCKESQKTGRDEFERIMKTIMGKVQKDEDDFEDDQPEDANEKSSDETEDEEPEEAFGDDPEEDHGAVQYKELEDGRFECLICRDAGDEKILKTESGIIRHIDRDHE